MSIIPAAPTTTTGHNMDSYHNISILLAHIEQNKHLLHASVTEVTHDNLTGTLRIIGEADHTPFLIHVIDETEDDKAYLRLMADVDSQIIRISRFSLKNILLELTETKNVPLFLKEVSDSILAIIS